MGPTSSNPYFRITEAPESQRALSKTAVGSEPGSPPTPGWGMALKDRSRVSDRPTRPSTSAGAAVGARPVEDVSSAWARASRGA